MNRHVSLNRFYAAAGCPANGKLVSYQSEKSIDFIPDEAQVAGDDGHAAFVLSDTLQFLFSVTSGILLYPFGYTPNESWERSNKAWDRIAQPGIVSIDLPEGIIVGAGYNCKLTHAKPIFFSDTGHLLIGSDVDAELVEVATNVYIGLKDADISCVVLRPTMHK